MRRKRVELQEAVIVAARRLAEQNPISWQTIGDVRNAVEALKAHDAAEMTGEGARWVHGSPETSRDAAGLASLAQGSARRRVVEMLHRGNATDDELERRSGNSHQTISSARNWLVEAGWVHDSGKRRATRSNRQAVVWELTNAGYRQIGEI